MTKRLSERELRGNLRHLRTREGCIDFTSNDYLGLARSGQLHSAITEKITALQTCVHGSTGSRLLTGHSVLFEQVEKKIAHFHRSEGALLYNSGYTASIGLLDALLQPGDCVVHDVHIHASFQDGIRLSKARKIPFRHNDTQHLENRLKTLDREQRVFVCVESVYSLDGSIAPLEAILKLCLKHQAQLVVDEAHAIGILGTHGEGLVSQLNLESLVCARVCTYGKAFGVHGAAIVGSNLLRKYLINFSRPFCYTTAMPIHNVIAIDCAYDIITNAEVERERLISLIAYFHALVEGSNIPVVKSSTPIQGVLIPGNERVKAVSVRLAASGFDVRAVMSPTVKRGSEILRLCLHSFNRPEDVERLVREIERAIKEVS